MDPPRIVTAVSQSESEPDGLLVARIAAGDEDAFMAAYDRHADILFGVVTRMLGDRESAGDVVQETYLALWRRAELFDPDAGSLRGWLLRIARNRTIDLLRSEARRPRIVRSPTVPDDEARTGWSQVHATDDDPGMAIERRWVDAVVRTAITVVPPLEREVLVLAYDDGLSQSEIAARLAIPIGTVKSRTRRAMAHLRELLLSIPDFIERAEPEAVDGSP